MPAVSEPDARRFGGHGSREKKTTHGGVTYVDDGCQGRRREMKRMGWGGQRECGGEARNDEHVCGGIP